MSDSKQQVYSNTKPIACGLVAVANKAWDEEVSATSLEDDIDVPCRPSPLTRQVARGVGDDDSKLFVKRSITPITMRNDKPV
jgi:hypothetical protein